MNNAREMEMLDTAEHLVEEVGHPLVVKVHVDHLSRRHHTSSALLTRPPPPLPSAHARIMSGLGRTTKFNSPHILAFWILIFPSLLFS